ncbi:MAG: hypothetical protein HYW51_01030 [Candidatus Doudnabacteria bacterium]|nr:hypothetical protein [Candidatus Doudnabacteria bacterium]
MTARALLEPPTMIFGSRHYLQAMATSGEVGPKPIPANGQWQFSLVRIRKNSWFFLPYIAFTFCSVHFRIGCRWDDVDHYYTLDSIALKIRKP